MKQETRVSKYAKLREDIDNIDEVILYNLQRKKSNVIKESMKHASSDQNLSVSNSLSIDDILKGHTELINMDDYNYEIDEKKGSKKKLFVFIGLIFIVVVILVCISLFRG